MKQFDAKLIITAQLNIPLMRCEQITSGSRTLNTPYELCELGSLRDHTLTSSPWIKQHYQ